MSSLTSRRHQRRVGLAASLIATALLIAVLAPMRDEIGLLNAGFLFLLLTLLVASYWGRQVGFFAALIANVAFNFFFLEPHYRFTVQEPENILALAVFLVVSVVGGTLISLAREAAARAEARQAEVEVVLALSRAMSPHIEPSDALRALCREVCQAFAATGAAVLTADGRWTVLAWAGSDAASRAPDAEERVSGDQAVALGSPVGVGATGFARKRRIVVPRGREVAYPARERGVSLVPLRVGDETLGLLRLDGPFGETPFRGDPHRLLGAVAAEAGLAVQRIQLASAAAHAEALRQADQLKTALMASISHDLKTPLAAIKASITSILDANVAWAPEDIEAFHRTIDAQTDRLNRVISDILDLNRIESGDLTPEQAPAYVADLLRNARDITAYETRGREVIVEAPDGLVVLADEALLLQAVVNLVENAAKYSHKDGAIHLRAEAAGDQARIVVADTGPGIAAADLPYVFDRFYRAEAPGRRVKGSGLGLTIVKGFVELSGGSVAVESSSEGTQFTIRLPVASKVAAAV